MADASATPASRPSKKRPERGEGRPRRVMPWGELTRPRREHGGAPPDGLVVVDKDKDVTSHDIVGAVRFLAGTRKVGHAGTLDPMATGVLCVGVGRATKLLQYVTGTSKCYSATICLGAETSTEDAQGEVTQRRGIAALGENQEAWRGLIDEAMAQLRGPIRQVPSSVSALKVNGKRAYELVREGHAVRLDARPVVIDDFRMMDEPRPSDVTAEVPLLDVDVEVVCSAGTYVRALARDLGDLLGTGAHLTSLRRTRVGKWDETLAHTVGTLNGFNVRGEELPLIGLTELCHGLFPLVEVTAEEAELLRRGQFIAKRDHVVGEEKCREDMANPAASKNSEGKPVAAAISAGSVVALVSPRSGMLKPDLLLS